MRELPGRHEGTDAPVLEELAARRCGGLRAAYRAVSISTLIGAGDRGLLYGFYAVLLGQVPTERANGASTPRRRPSECSTTGTT